MFAVSVCSWASQCLVRHRYSRPELQIESTARYEPTIASNHWPNRTTSCEYRICIRHPGRDRRSKLVRLVDPRSFYCSMTRRLALEIESKVSRTNRGWIEEKWELLTNMRFADIFRVNFFRFLRWPPRQHVHFDSTLRSWPFQSDVCRIGQREYVRDGIWSNSLIHLLRVRTLNAITDRIDLNRIFFAGRHIRDISFRRSYRRQIEPFLFTFGAIANGIRREFTAFRWIPMHEHGIAGHFLDAHVSRWIWIWKRSWVTLDIRYIRF